VRVLELIKRLCRRPEHGYPRHASYQLLHDGHGLTLSCAPSEEQIWHIAWADVRRATAFKRDLLTTDLVCISLDLSSRTVEFNEEMTGWTSVVEALHHVLPGAHPYSEWWPAVVKPAFEGCSTTIFERRDQHVV
jgi:hypothetical protein